MTSKWWQYVSCNASQIFCNLDYRIEKKRAVYTLVELHAAKYKHGWGPECVPAALMGRYFTNHWTRAALAWI